MRANLGPFAYVDESYISRDDHPGVYLLAAVLIERDELAEVEQATRTAAAGAGFHATVLHNRGRMSIIEDVLDVAERYAAWNVVVAQTPITAGLEAARQESLQQLLRYLDRQRVSDVILDVRGSPMQWAGARDQGLAMPEHNYRDLRTYRHVDHQYVGVVDDPSPAGEAVHRFGWFRAGDLAGLEMFDDTRMLATVLFSCLDDVVTGRVDPVAAVRPLAAGL